MATGFEFANGPAPSAGVDSGPRDEDERRPITAVRDVHTRSDPSAGRFSSAHRLRASARSGPLRSPIRVLAASPVQVLARWGGGVWLGHALRRGGERRRLGNGARPGARVARPSSPVFFTCEDIPETYREPHERGVRFITPPHEAPFGRWSMFEDEGTRYALHRLTHRTPASRPAHSSESRTSRRRRLSAPADGLHLYGARARLGRDLPAP